jgi:hypothetical protein
MDDGDSMHPDPGSNREARAGGARRSRVAIATLCLAVHGCTVGSGGAVELSWALRPTSSGSNAKFADCTEQDRPDPRWSISRVRLHWQDGDTTCSHAWDCNDNHGATGFELPTGPANLWLTLECGMDPHPALCADDQAASPDSYIAPAIVQRNVIRGETVTLGAVQLVVSIESCPLSPCVCPQGVAQDHTIRNPGSVTGLARPLPVEAR